jgi:hypothetical protein
MTLWRTLSSESSGSATVVSMERLIWCDIETVPDYEVWKPESLAWALFH